MDRYGPHADDDNNDQFAEAEREDFNPYDGRHISEVPSAATPTLKIISFGYGHGPAPENVHQTHDLRPFFRDPHFEMRARTARDPMVVDAVLGTPGVPPYVINMSVLLAGLLAAPGTKGEVRVAIGCVDGKHRAPVIAQRVALTVQSLGYHVTVEDRDIDKPVIERGRDQ